jgi:hypothetical protein
MCNFESYGASEKSETCTTSHESKYANPTPTVTEGWTKISKKATFAIKSYQLLSQLTQMMKTLLPSLLLFLSTSVSTSNAWRPGDYLNQLRCRLNGIDVVDSCPTEVDPEWVCPAVYEPVTCGCKCEYINLCWAAGHGFPEDQCLPKLLLRRQGASRGGLASDDETTDD